MIILPRLNKHGRKRPYTEKYDDLHGRVLRPYISVSYTEKNGDLRTKKRSCIAFVYGGRIRSPFFSVYDRIVPYTITEIYDRNTRPCNTAKYGRIRKNTERTRSFTGVYGLRIRRPGWVCNTLYVT